MDNNRRPKKRQLFSPDHQQIKSNDEKRYLNLMQPEQLQHRGIAAIKAQLIINAYPTLLCPKCGNSRWCHVFNH